MGGGGGKSRSKLRIVAGSFGAIDKTDRAIDFLERDGGAGKLLFGQMDIRNKNRRLFRASRSLSSAR
jgi:hypothetical protein